MGFNPDDFPASYRDRSVNRYLDCSFEELEQELTSKSETYDPDTASEAEIDDYLMAMFAWYYLGYDQRGDSANQPVTTGLLLSTLGALKDLADAFDEADNWKDMAIWLYSLVYGVVKDPDSGQLVSKNSKWEDDGIVGTLISLNNKLDTYSKYLQAIDTSSKNLRDAWGYNYGNGTAVTYKNSPGGWLSQIKDTLGYTDWELLSGNLNDAGYAYRDVQFRKPDGTTFKVRLKGEMGSISSFLLVMMHWQEIINTNIVTVNDNVKDINRRLEWQWGYRSGADGTLVWYEDSPYSFLRDIREYTGVTKNYDVETLQFLYTLPARITEVRSAVEGLGSVLVRINEDSSAMRSFLNSISTFKLETIKQNQGTANGYLASIAASLNTNDTMNSGLTSVRTVLEAIRDKNTVIQGDNVTVEGTDMTVSNGYLLAISKALNTEDDAASGLSSFRYMVESYLSDMADSLKAISKGVEDPNTAHIYELMNKVMRDTDGAEVPYTRFVSHLERIEELLGKQDDSKPAPDGGKILEAELKPIQINIITNMYRNGNRFNFMRKTVDTQFKEDLGTVKLRIENGNLSVTGLEANLTQLERIPLTQQQMETQQSNGITYSDFPGDVLSFELHDIDGTAYKSDENGNVDVSGLGEFVHAGLYVYSGVPADLESKRYSTWLIGSLSYSDFKEVSSGEVSPENPTVTGLEQVTSRLDSIIRLLTVAGVVENTKDIFSAVLGDLALPATASAIDSIKGAMSTAFPFCIPSVVNLVLFGSVVADPQAPVWEFDIAGTPLVVDFAPYEDFAEVCRWTVRLLFVAALLLNTRKFVYGVGGSE